jgi:hypothetical protein
MAKFTWQDGTLVSKAKVEIGGVIYDVDPEEYSGTTPLSAANLNAMQDGIYEDLGDKSQLNTNSKTNLVNAINSIIDAEIYSTEEVKTNKIWIDGKPIYRKVVDLGTISGTHATKTLYDGYYDTIVDFDGYKYKSTNKMSLNSDTSSSNWMRVDYYIESSNDLSINVHRNSTGVWTDWSIKIIIEYTKTTD